uniref:hypothetical protein n=1 Tax=Prevotella sp. TaxID=59823 RepID=UPI004027D8A4
MNRALEGGGVLNSVEKIVNELSLAQILACLCLLFADNSFPLCQRNKSTYAEYEMFNKEDFV